MRRTSQPSTARRGLFVALAIVGLGAAGFLIYTAVCALLAPSTAVVDVSSGLLEVPPLAEEVSPPKETPQAQSEPEPTPPAADIPIGYARGNRAPEFTLRSLNGESVSLSDFRGHMVILDFWASWCTPCRVSMPNLHSLWERYRDRGVVLIGISLDRAESAARSYLEANGFDEMIALWESTTASQAVASKYGVVGIPRTLVIDAHGIVRFAGHPVTLTQTLIELYL